MPFPFLYLAISLTSGILVSSLLLFPFSIFVSGLLGSLIFAWLAFFLKKNRLAFVFSLIATLFIGLSLYSRENKIYEQNAIKQFDFNGYADFYGRLYKSPSYGV